MRTLRFHEYGAALDVLRLEDAEAPAPGPGQIRVAVQACGLTPADWALCGGLFPGDLPRGIGLEVSGTVDAVGEGVTGTAVGDPVFGPVPFTGPTAGASELALLDTWFPRPARLGPVDAAALPMAVETGYRGIDDLGVREGSTVLVHAAGTTVGYAAVQIALRRGARVIATAGETYADSLRAFGAEVTGYGEGMVERVAALAGGPVDLALNVSPVPGALPDIVRTVKEPDHVLTLNDLALAGEFGVRTGAGVLRTDVIGEYGRLAAEGLFSVPVARTFPLEDWRAAAELSGTGKARGKLVLRIG
ncbi:NADP-dependent oxidoreductase [Streptomyces sp. 8L]|uniref:NADP-dependent oxidoreductase n=1 Tax=Streptomyces sp. 8L TaxID=2877242 RepID=UPI001CD24688|nr:NADP-dependent oxidoreductase [Streptomyces sp. 8L]MCA1219535.1 NADP-dependent oxidoreductase [Streptomyces sp. 8L]